jgi:hypothetical protein
MSWSQASGYGSGSSNVTVINIVLDARVQRNFALQQRRRTFLTPRIPGVLMVAFELTLRRPNTRYESRHRWSGSQPIVRSMK